MRTPIRQCATGTFVVGLTLCGAHALGVVARPNAAAVAPVRGEEITLPTHRGPQKFILATPDAADSDAELVASPAAIAHGRPATIPGYRVYARVVSRANDRAPVDAAAAKVRASVAPVDASGRRFKGHWVAGAPTVRDAARLAQSLRADRRVEHAYVEVRQPLSLRVLPTDPGVASQWHLKNFVNPLSSINVEPVWTAGLTGTGITVGIVEIGFDANHPDLVNKFNSTASQPDWGFSGHGNATAGLVGAEAFNLVGGVGVAYGALVSRQYIGPPTDVADAESFRNDLNSIKSNSWGPSDSGTIWEITPIELQSLADAVNCGRGGKGTVVVWAAGNGGQNEDRVEYDPYASSRYVIAVGALDNQDRASIYDEPGSSKLVTTTSSYDFVGSAGSGIYTCSYTPDFTSFFGGTSAAAPIASGVIALMLQANPNLTWRDVAHILVRSSRKANPGDPGWTQNGAGRWQHYHYGYGAIDAAAAVTMAQTWTTVTQAVEITYPPVSVNTDILDDNPAGVTSTFSVWPNMNVERVQIILTANHERLGDLRVRVNAPSGTESLLADAPRVNDYSPGYDGYTLTSVRHWDENPRGMWTINLADLFPEYTSTFTSWQLRLIGSRLPCPSDWNRSHAVTIQDIFDFLNSWLGGKGDFNNDAVTTIQDLFDFLTSWFGPHSGC